MNTSDYNTPRSRAPRKLGRRTTSTKSPELFDDISYGTGTGSYAVGNEAGPSDIYQSYSHFGYNQPIAGDQFITQEPYSEPRFQQTQPQQTYQASVPAPVQQQAQPPPTVPAPPIVNEILTNPVSGFAAAYGKDLAGQSSQYVQSQVQSYMQQSKIKYYFAVDTKYVLHKLLLLIFPYANKDWSIQHTSADQNQQTTQPGAPYTGVGVSENTDSLVAPRYDHMAPDLYIPTMAIVTYVLTAGLALGVQNRFSPERLSDTCSSVLVWLAIEILAVCLAKYMLSVSSTRLRYLDLVSLCGYKYVGMIVSLLTGLVVNSATAYYLMLAWTGCAIAFFLMRSLKVMMMPPLTATVEPYQSSLSSMPTQAIDTRRRRLYLLFTVAVIQPLIMWRLTSHLLQFTNENVVSSTTKT